MSDASIADRIRAYVEWRGEPDRVPLETFLRSWGPAPIEPGRLAELEAELARVGVVTTPPLTAAQPGQELEVGLAPEPTPEPEPQPEPEPHREPDRVRELRPRVERPRNGQAVLAVAVALAGVALLFAPARLYGYALVAGLLSLAVARAGRVRIQRHPELGGGRLLAAAMALAAIALVGGVVRSTTIDIEDGRRQASVAAPPTPGTSGKRARESVDRNGYCTSGAADRISRLSGTETTDPDRLARVTTQLLDATKDAPPGAFCAVTALDTLADTWNLRSSQHGYDDAKDQVDKIRTFQDDRDLRRAVY